MKIDTTVSRAWNLPEANKTIKKPQQDYIPNNSNS